MLILNELLITRKSKQKQQIVEIINSNVFKYNGSEVSVLNLKRTSYENTVSSLNNSQASLKLAFVNFDKVPYQAMRHNSSFRTPDNQKSESADHFYHSFKLRDTTVFH